MSYLKESLPLKTITFAGATKEWEFHNAMLGVEAQVVVLFRRDSNEVQALGLKKSFEIRAGRRAKGATRAQG